MSLKIWILVFLTLLWPFDWRIFSLCHIQGSFSLNCLVFSGSCCRIVDKKDLTVLLSLFSDTFCLILLLYEPLEPPLVEKMFSLSALLLCPALPRPSPSFLVKQAESTPSLRYRESLFSDTASFLSAGSENLFWECLSLFRLSNFSLSSDRILFLLPFL